ncbi:MAG: glucosamine-6-phosphate deaminase [Candidatus Obscuribacterales bacterium]|nr:glucosamine-6-phosphate deaminase [Candidatus Obscuribacterales bacterium]
MPEAFQTLSKIVAKLVADLIREKPNACIGFPTGRTPRLCYEFLSESSRNGEIDWSGVRCFGLDEYVDAEEKHSFRHFLEENLYSHTNLKAENLYNPLFVDDYDRAIADAGGLDLCILGLGLNGHIAFNEPGTPLQSWTHSVLLTESTRQANAEFFQGGRIPSRAVTMGLSTLLASRKIILMVTGAAKKEILSRAMRAKISSEVPASFLQDHPELMVLADFDY